MEKVLVNIDYADKNYSAGTGQIGGVVMATAKTMEEAKAAFESAFAFHLKGCIADGDDLPRWAVEGDYGFDYKLSVSALLQYFDGILTRAALARVTGIHERQLGHYATGYRKPRPEQRDKIIEGFHRLAKEFSAVV